MSNIHKISQVYFDEDDEENREAEVAVKQDVGRRRYSTKKATPHDILPVEKVTASMLANVVTEYVTQKVYDPINGTRCGKGENEGIVACFDVIL